MASGSVAYVQRVVDGQRLRAYRLHQAAPDAPIVAMVHGLESSWETWCALRRGCLEHFRLFALDLPWAGQDGYYWCYVRPAHEWLQLTLDLLPAPPAFVVAHSYGVNVVLEYLQRHSMPNLAGLVLMSTFYRPDFAENDWMLFERCLKGFRAIFEEGIRLRRGRSSTRRWCRRWSTRFWITSDLRASPSASHTSSGRRRSGWIGSVCRRS